MDSASPIYTAGLFDSGSIQVRKYTPGLADSSLSKTFSISLLGPATAFPVQLESSAVLNLLGSPKTKKIFKVALGMLFPIHPYNVNDEQGRINGVIFQIKKTYINGN
jgi:hypothetical protein